MLDTVPPMQQVLTPDTTGGQEQSVPQRMARPELVNTITPSAEDVANITKDVTMPVDSSLVPAAPELHLNTLPGPVEGDFSPPIRKSSRMRRPKRELSPALSGKTHKYVEH